MSLVLITGSSGLVGSESVDFFCQKGFDVVGIDNDLRKYFFGKKASTKWQTKILLKKYKNFKNCNIDIRNYPSLKKIFSFYKKKICLIIHCAAQPSHDWAKSNVFRDFDVNANGGIDTSNAYATDPSFTTPIVLNGSGYIATAKNISDFPTVDISVTMWIRTTDVSQAGTLLSFSPISPSNTSLLKLAKLSNV